jgi:dTDP-4-dehydrorhamnose reductase
VKEANPRHVVLRTGWVFGASGRNFATRIMAGAAAGTPLRVVADQRGNPTFAPDLAAAILDIASRIAAGGGDVSWGTYHAAASGATSWHGLACAILAATAGNGRPATTVEAIPTSDYVTGARRPLNSELDCARLKEVFAIRLPPWQEGVAACVAELEDR